jgi:glutaminyl-peptide cyclotransferase
VDILHYVPQTNKFFEHHHCTTDDLSTIDKNTLKAVGQTLLELIYNED